MRGTRVPCVWTALVLCAVLVLGVMTWLTRSVLASERRADLQERIRLSLWRMDAAGTALIVAENQRSSDSPPPEIAIQSRFEIDGAGHLTATTGDSAELQRLLAKDEVTNRQIFRGMCMVAAPEPPPEPLAQTDNSIVQGAKSGRYSEAGQQIANKAEWASRDKSVGNALKGQKIQEDAPAPPELSQAVFAPSQIEISPFAARWLSGELFLLRAVSSKQTRSLQGVWLDAAEIGRRLTGEVADLLPEAKLLPAAPGKDADDGLLLASFPLRLEPGPVPVLSTDLRQPIVISLMTGWVAAAVAIATASFLMRGVMRLSERRASFVSAVTHELRTPLTTFRLYSDMLESGAVKEEKRGDYLRVLSREADRLAHLVENVLAFSRIERGSARTQVKVTTLGELLEPMRERLAARLETVGMTLEMDLSGLAAARQVRVDAAAVEHILFNLVDNAAKYAAGADPPVVSIAPEIAGIRVADHGPGIAPAERKRIFQAFHKSARDAAESRPGVGLGLALSRRLARSLRGELRCVDAAGGGACFVLELP